MKIHSILWHREGDSNETSEKHQSPSRDFRKNNTRLLGDVMSDTTLAPAVSMAKILFNSRQQFLSYLHSAALQRIAANRSSSLPPVKPDIRSEILAQHGDEALKAIYEDGLLGLEDALRCAVDEVIRENLNAIKNCAQDH
jgi:hypothetical protein